VTLRTLPELQTWIDRAKDVGHVAVVSTTTSFDPMQAELSGFALALSANEACYVPLVHKKEGDGSGLFSGGLAADQNNIRDALAALKPLFEDSGVLKISDDMKFNTLLFAQHGINVVAIDDITLISYVLNAGRM